MTDSDEVKLLPCPPLTITGLDGRLLFRVNADGTADGVVADASEAARIFAETVAPYFTRPPVVTDEVVEPSIFDLLEPLAKALDEAGGPNIRGGFARMTGGVDIPFIVAAIGSVER